LHDRFVYRRHPWSVYAVFATTLNPPAFFIDGLLFYLLHRATANESHNTRVAAFLWLGIFMFVAKFCKNIDHYRHHPVDLLLVPCSIMFGWFHGSIKLYSLVTINVTTWGSRAAADSDANYGRMPLAKQNALLSRPDKKILESKAQEKDARLILTLP